ncbi:MAG: hypothetical protein ABEH86_02420 [Haloarcula sp.]
MVVSERRALVKCGAANRATTDGTADRQQSLSNTAIDKRTRIAFRTRKSVLRHATEYPLGRLKETTPRFEGLIGATVSHTTDDSVVLVDLHDRVGHRLDDLLAATESELGHSTTSLVE